jgi:hypothetical protein
MGAKAALAACHHQPSLTAGYPDQQVFTAIMCQLSLPGPVRRKSCEGDNLDLFGGIWIKWHIGRKLCKIFNL